MKTKTQFVCQSCGAVHPRWAGQCGSCGEWNSIVEELVGRAQAAPATGRRASGLEFSSLRSQAAPVPRISSGIGELDRVLGGGIVRGSAVLVGGDPGIGKSTLLLQAAANLARAGTGVAYISGEESLDQVRMRARRLGLDDAAVDLASSNDAFAIGQALVAMKKPVVAIIDSIQTMSMVGLDSAPGTVSQIRACANELIRVAKDHDIPIFFVSHVTKEGVVAGPKVLEHAVDCTIYFVGDNTHQYRMVRAIKNRFGATDEIGVFRMTDGGLEEVANASEIFLSDRRGDVAGSVVFPGIEGTRPILVEVQALVAPSSYSSAQRAVVGWDKARLSMILAVLQSRCGLDLGMSDVYLNVVGGFRITEPAADLAVAAALISSHLGKPLPQDVVVFGEIGLGGEVRAVGQAESRLKEAAKLGFGKVLLPEPGGAASKSRKPADAAGMAPLFQRRLLDLVAYIESL